LYGHLKGHNSFPVTMQISHRVLQLNGALAAVFEPKYEMDAALA
jgi:hypothetical protein